MEDRRWKMEDRRWKMENRRKMEDGRSHPPSSILYPLFSLLLVIAVTGCRDEMYDQPKFIPLRKTNFFSDSLSSRPPVPGTVARGHLNADKVFYTGLAQSTTQGAQTNQTVEGAVVPPSGDTRQPNLPTGQTSADATVRGQQSAVAQGQAPAQTTTRGTQPPQASVAAPGAQAVTAGADPMAKFVTVMPMPVTRQLLLRGEERFNIYCSPCHGRTGEGNGMIVQRGMKRPPSYHIDRLRQAPVGYFYDVITNGFGAMYSYASRVHPEDRWAIIAYIRALQLSENARIDDVPAGDRTKLEEQR
jgi:mono/diheme cytochrome c family protein